MNGWIKGLLIGGGVAVACSAIAFLLGREEQRRFLQELYQQYSREAAAVVSQFAGSAQGTARQIMNRRQT